MKRHKIYSTRAAKQKAWRQRQAARRAYAIRMWVLPPKERAHLLKDVPWLAALSREAETLRSRLNEAERLSTIGRKAEEKINALLGRVAELEQRERRREQNKDWKRRRREGGILVPSDPAAIQEHYQQADRPSAFAQTEPTIGPNLGQIDPTDWTRSRQNQDKIGPRIGQGAPRPVPGEDDWRKYVGIPRASIAPPRSAPAPSAASGGSQLLERIKKHGYTTDAKTQRVLYGGDRWITPEEWVKLMPGVLD